MANLAIRGHATRGREVIELLEMLGGINKYNLRGNEDEWFVLNGTLIQRSDRLFAEKGFPLEQFLEKFPYKVGDKVINKNYKQIFEILSVRWCAESNTIMYQTSNGWYSVHGLKPYKKETMEERENSIVVNNEYKQLKVHSLRFDKTQLMINDEYELKQEGNAYYIIRRKPQYPKTYEGCCKILDISPHNSLCLNTHIDYDYVSSQEERIFDKISSLYRLLVCRDAYWKIAGEQMGLGKPWKPDFLNPAKETRYFLFCTGTTIENGQALFPTNKILIFPTEEMRDAFHENFKDLIEECKELL